MATVSTWETIHKDLLPNYYHYVNVYDKSVTPQRQLFAGLIYPGFNFDNIDLIISQHVGVDHGDLSKMTNTYKYLETSLNMPFRYNYCDLQNITDTPSSFTNVDLDVIYDWSYENNRPANNLSLYPTNLLDYRQLFFYTYRDTSDGETYPNAAATFESGTQFFNEPVFPEKDTVFKIALKDIDYPADFNFDYNYDYNVYRSIPGGYGATFTWSLDGKKYVIAATCYRYCLYYTNDYGGWQSILMKGRPLKTDSFTPSEYYNRKKFTSSTYIESQQNIRYQTEIINSWQLNTGYLHDDESELLQHLFRTNNVYLHDLDLDHIYAVSLTDKKQDLKYMKDNKKFVTYTINVKADKTKFRMN